jgi:pimeloyl-ACP methyl ester carboxylesterase
MRFASNGYPASYVAVYEYDSTFSTNTLNDVWAGLDRRIATLRKQTGADRVDILGHSLGTFVMFGYLGSSPARAAKVAHYVNIDGMTGAAPPGGVPTLALWAGRGALGRQIVGATNVTIPDQTHVQSATSAESFVEMYKFFTGRNPTTTDIVPELSGQVTLAGRAVIFPQNQGVQNGTLQIWRVNGATGARIGKRPEATYPLFWDGAWGPFRARGGQNYEFVVVRRGLSTAHFYYEPFARSDYLVRLNLDPPSGGIASLADTSDHQSNLLILRYKEFWGDQGAGNDTLQIDGVNVVNAATSPLSKLVNGVLVYDEGADGVSNPTVPIPSFFALPFLTGVDLFIPGATPPNGTIPVVLTPRGGGGSTQVINVRNWASSTEVVTVQFHDYL